MEQPLPRTTTSSEVKLNLIKETVPGFGGSSGGGIFAQHTLSLGYDPHSA